MRSLAYVLHIHVERVAQTFVLASQAHARNKFDRVRPGQHNWAASAMLHGRLETRPPEHKHRTKKTTHTHTTHRRSIHTKLSATTPNRIQLERESGARPENVSVGRNNVGDMFGFVLCGVCALIHTYTRKVRN